MDAMSREPRNLTPYVVTKIGLLVDEMVRLEGRLRGVNREEALRILRERDALVEEIQKLEGR